MENCTLLERFLSNSGQKFKIKIFSIALLSCLLLSINLNGQTFSVVGAGTTNSGTSYANPYNNGYWGNKTQQFITAAQLTAAGISANAVISQVGFNVTVAGTGVPANLAGYTVKVYTTTAANPISAGFVGATLVAQSTPGTLNVGTTGWKMATLNTAFTWDGTSNLVIETCFNNTNWASTYAQVQWTTTGLGTGTWSRWYRADASTVCGSTLSTATSTTSRPNIRFAWTVSTPCSGTPAPGNTISSSATVAPGGTVNLSLQTATSGTGVSYQWQSAPTSTGTWTNFGTSSATQTSPAITANTWFRCLVTCSGNTGTSNPVQVIPSYCTPSGTSAYTINSVTTTGGITNISNTTTGNGGYGNFTAQSASNSIGTATNLTVTHSATGGGAGVGVWIDWNNDLDFADVNEQIAITTGWNYSPFTATINIPAGTPVGNYRMRIVLDYNAIAPSSCPVAISGESEDYTFTVATPPSCAVPSALVSSAVTATSATISWAAASPAPASGYQYFISTSATAPTAGTTPTGTTAAGVLTANLTGLTANTTYYFWVRSNCGGSGTSAWAGAASFYTGPCVPTGTSAYTINSVTTTGGITNISNTTAGNGGYGNFTAQSASNSIGTATNLTVTHSATGGGAGVGVWINWNNDLDFADANEQIAITTGWNYSPFTATINIPAGTPVGNYRMRIVLDYNAIAPSSCPVAISGESEDYTFTVATPPSCSTPSALTSSAVTATSATISWAAASPAPASGYEYYVSSSSTAPTAGTTPTGTTSAGVLTANLTGLTANTTYYFWVRSNCGGSGTSAWAGAASFYTGPCVPTGTAAYYITNVTTTGGTANIANATGSNGGYGNFMAQSASNSIGTGTNFSVAHTATGGGAGVGVWINWNNDLDFADANEQIAITTGWNFSPFTGTINIPAGTPAGNYQMRVVVDYNAIAPSSCPVAIAGESEDYTFTVIALPPCAGTPNPGATTATSSQVFAGGSTTLGITTPQNGTGITFQWQSSASASGPWASIGGATASTYVATPTAATYYQCVVTCAAGPASATSTPILISFNAYCNPDYTGYSFTPQNGSEGTVDGDMITNVTITLGATTLLNNSSTAALSSPQYTFYSSLPTVTMYPSNTYNVNVTAGAFTNQNFAVWIDYNDDNDFYDAGELIGYSLAATTAAYQTISFPINLACTPPFGTHRMRIRDAYATTASTMDPCTTYGWGETEDYLITIVAGTPFAPAFVSTPTTPNCVGVQVTYTATSGQTNYAWTFPGTSGVDYTLVSGGTSTSNTAVVVYNNSGSKTITMNYASPLGCASSGAINNTITVGAGTLATAVANGDVIWRGATSVDWATPSNWYLYNGTTYTVAGVSPSSTTRTIIPNNTCVTQQPSVAAGTTVNAKDVVIETGATLTMTTGTLNVNGNFTNNGTFVAGTGKVAFNTAATVSGNATTFNDVDLNNGVNFGSLLSTVNGTMTINNGGWVNTNAPTYGLNSLLKYNTGGTYGRWLEWSATSGPGYPNDVQVSNNTTINYPNTGGAFSTNLGVRRNLTIDGGSNLYMDYGTGNASGSLTVGGNVTSAGDLSLGNQIGGDIYVGGNWTRTTGNFYPNNRAVFFNGATGNQTITKTGGETFPFMIVNKASGNVILANNVTVSGGLTLTNGLVEVGTNNMIMGGATLTGGSATSYVKTASTGVMSRNVGASAITFPVGNSSYNPAMVTNAGTADVFTLRVIDNVTADGTGVGAPTTEAVVNRTWMVNETTTGGSNVTLRLYWNGAGEQINGFNPASAFIAHYIASSGLWDNIGFSGQGAGYFETNNITSFSPFTISSSTTFAPLPIELVSFQANCAGDDKINVTWTTASEHNTSHYIVEHSRNGNDWEALTMVAAAGNSTSLLDYTYVHENPNAGTNYYRLTQYDNDGVFEQFNAVAVDCDNMNNTTALSTYPNPSEGSFYISLFTEDMEGAGVITLTDAKGTVVFTQDVNIQNGNTIFHMDNLNVAPGMYYIQITNGSIATDIVKHSLR